MEGRSLYIHIPFCKQKCFYCDFPSFSGKESLRDDYLSALKKEIELRVGDMPINTIFIGGGTPTYLNEEELLFLCEIVKKVNLKDGGEFTVECNPGTLNKKKLEIFKSMGVNRLSIGLQASQNSILKKIGRIHTYEKFEENFLLARSMGFNNINVDLMFGLPNQSVEDWKETLEKVTSLSPEHISAYSLIIEEGTAFYILDERGKLELPDEDSERRMYMEGIRMLKKKGYNQYEISNFAKPGYECRHNIVYWNLDEYIGVGSAAHSYVDEKRTYNSTDIQTYIDNIFLNGSSVEGVTENTIKDDMEEFMFMGLRKINGISINDFQRRFNKNIYEVYSDVILQHVKEGLLIDDGNRIYLTPHGIELSNYVMKDFIISV